MNTNEFLEAVLPSQGYIIIAEPLSIPGLTHTPYRHHVFETLEEAVAKAGNLSFEHKNVFFALAGFKEPKVWNPTAKNNDGSQGKWQTRTQTNAGWLKSLFLDLDVDANPPPEKATKVFASKEEAIAGLRDFCKKLSLPKPMLLDSGGGIHAYWPLDRDVTKAEWQPLADRFKNICIKEQLKIDPAVPADAARVLRVLGCPNLKRDYARPVALLTAGAGETPPESIAALFDLYESKYGPATVTPSGKKYAPSAMDSNMAKDYSPINFGAVAFACGVVGGQVACGGKGTHEPLWRATVGIAKFASQQRAALLSISDQHDNFTEDELDHYVDKWNAGPTTCAYFQSLGCGECASCPHQGKVTSPASLGNMLLEAEPPKVTMVDPETGLDVEYDGASPPAPYVRAGSANHLGLHPISIRSEDKDGNPYFVPVSPADIYPVRILRSAQNGEVQEKTLWKFELARMGYVTLEVKQSILSDAKSLHSLLMNVGIYPTVSEAKAIQDYMSAYLKKLASEFDRERIINRLGWQDGHKEFVAGQRLIHPDGSVTNCNLSQSARNTTKDGMHTNGASAEWSRLVNSYYVGDNYRAHRFFLYCSFAAPLLHMAGHKGAVITATGASGRGKTTVLKVGSSIWGSPDSLILNGTPQGSTVNALYNHIGTLHSLPMMWDDVTDREAEEMINFALNISQGRGKERMKGSEHDGKVTEWETMILSTANNDKITQILATRRDAQPHLMRMLGVPFDDFADTTEGKIKAEHFLARIHDHYGHAGVPFMQYVTKNYAKVKERIEQTKEEVDHRLGAKGHERFWTAIVAVALVAGSIARKLGLIDFPIEADAEWMFSHISEVRALHRDYEMDGAEKLAVFLEERIGQTLVMSSKSTSNLDNVALQPHQQLAVRHEMDNGLLFIAKTELAKYAAKMNENMRTWELELISAGLLLERSRLKTLGADTKYSKGQVRCWVINADKLGVRFPMAAMPKSNVVPLAPTGT